MSSILKILVDIQCIVYCDFVEIGEANPYSLFRLHILCNNNEITHFYENDSYYNSEYRKL